MISAGPTYPLDAVFGRFAPSTGLLLNSREPAAHLPHSDSVTGLEHLSHSRPEWGLRMRPGKANSQHAWTDDAKPLRLMEQDHLWVHPVPKALACYELLVRWVTGQGRSHEQT